MIDNGHSPSKFPVDAVFALHTPRDLPARAHRTVRADFAPAPERSIVQLDKERANRLVEGGDREEGAVA